MLDCYKNKDYVS